MTTHAELLAALLPAVYDSTTAVVLGAELAAEGAALDAVLVSADTLRAEMDPATATALLHAYEQWLGLPDKCAVAAGQTLAQRRAAAAARWSAEGGLSLGYLQQLCATAGYPDVDLHETSTPWVWRAAVPTAAVVTRFRAGSSRAGDRVATWQAHPVTCLLMRAKPAHTRLVVVFSGAVND